MKMLSLDDAIRAVTMLLDYETDTDKIWSCDVINNLRNAPSVTDVDPGQWISVRERLPEDNRFVLVCNDDGKMMVAQYIEETVQWQYRYIAYDVEVWDDTEQGPVCWWMPLPELPKEQDDAKVEERR